MAFAVKIPLPSCEHDDVWGCRLDQVEIHKNRSSFGMEVFTDWLPLPEWDTRVHGRLFGHVLPLAIIMPLFILIVKVAGPWMMRNTSAYELRPVLLGYNAAMVIANLWISTNVIYHAFWKGHYSVWDTKPDLGTHPTTLLLLDFFCYYLALRLTMCLETVLSVLRKRQVSYIGVYHHWVVYHSLFLYIAHGGFSLACFELASNALIQAVVYSYYFLSAWGPSVQRYLWWKKYLTILQLIHLVIMILRNRMLISFIETRYRTLPVFMVYLCVISFLRLLNFYNETYR